MATLSVWVEINKGVRGVPLPKLGSILEESQKFLSMLGEDVGLSDPSGWVGVDFKNSSLSFLAEKTEDVLPADVHSFNAAFVSIMDKAPVASLRRATVAQYAKIANSIGPDEAVTFQLFDTPKNSDVDAEDNESLSGQVAFSQAMIPLRRFDLTKSEALAIQVEVQARVRARGAIQGRIHSLFLGAHPPYFNLRELSTGILIRCEYDRRKYEEIAVALQKENAILHVYGYTTTDLVERKLEELQVEKIVVAPTISEAEFDSMFGSMPNFTGKLTTQEFINFKRGRAN